MTPNDSPYASVLGPLAAAPGGFAIRVTYDNLEPLPTLSLPPDRSKTAGLNRQPLLASL